VSALPPFDAYHHPTAVDVADLQLQELAASEPRAVQHQEQRAVIEIFRAGDQAADFVGTQDGGKPSVSLRGREILLQLASLEHTDKEEAQGRDMEP
jgi:hypothetical protein